jgi:CRISPR system Cascade subunit CasB
MTTDPATAPTGSAEQPRRQMFWERNHKRDVPDGADLAALRRGIGREPGSVPAMWRYYTTLDSEGKLTARLRAEHVALTLYSIHQQSIPTSMHQLNQGLGRALLELRRSDKFSPAAVDQRFGAAATATSLDEAAYHLRGLVRQLRQLPQGFDYTALWQDLTAWQYPDRIGRVRRQWGAQYFLGRDKAETTASR